MRSSGLVALRSAALSVACMAAGCLGDEALGRECRGDLDCVALEVCRYSVCVAASLLEVDASAGSGDAACTTPACECPGCVAGVNEQVSCGDSGCERRCDAGWVDVDDSVAGCEYRCTPTLDTTEICDGLDNDCDGVEDSADDNYSGPACGVTVGVCAAARRGCERGDLLECDDATYAAAAIDAEFETGLETWCDGADNNCDGSTDELCCSDVDRERLVATGAWLVAGVAARGDGWEVHAVNLDEGDDRGRWMSWSLQPLGAATSGLDGAWDLCAGGESVDAVALVPGGDALVVACSATAGHSRLVLARSGGQEVSELASLSDQISRIVAATTLDRIAVVAELADPLATTGGAVLISAASDGSPPWQRVLDDHGPIDAIDIVASGDRFWWAGVDADTGDIRVEQLGAGTAATATGQIDADAAGGPRAPLVLLPFGTNDAAIAWASEVDGGTHQALLLKTGVGVTVVDRGGVGLEGVAAAQIGRVEGNPRGVAAVDADAALVVEMAAGFETAEALFGAAWPTRAGASTDAATGVAWAASPSGIFAAVGIDPDLLVPAVWRVGRGAAALCTD